VTQRYGNLEVGSVLGGFQPKTAHWVSVFKKKCLFTKKAKTGFSKAGSCSFQTKHDTKMKKIIHR